MGLLGGEVVDSFTLLLFALLVLFAERDYERSEAGQAQVLEEIRFRAL